MNATATATMTSGLELFAPQQPASQPTSPAIEHRCPEPGCDRQFNRKYTLAEHMKTHTGERPHLCPAPDCGKRFSTSGNLSRHKRLHGYIEPLKCPVAGCICTFPSNNKLEKHMKFHYGGNVKVCSVPGCGKTFSTTGNLNRHLKNHHDVTEICASPEPSSDKGLPTGSPTCAMEQWGSMAPVDEFALWSETCFAPMGAAPAPAEGEKASNQDLMDALVTLLDDDDVVMSF